MTVRQSVEPKADYRALNKKLAVTNVAENLVVLGGPGNLECIREFTFITDLGVYIDISGAVAVAGSATAILVEGGETWIEENVAVSAFGDGATSKISFINKTAGQRPTVRGYVAGY
jgi:hypothetical protein